MPRRTPIGDLIHEMIVTAKQFGPEDAKLRSQLLLKAKELWDKHVEIAPAKERAVKPSKGLQKMIDKLKEP
jgi:hypothetical protein